VNLPVSWALALQSRLSKEPLQASKIEIALDPASKIQIQRTQQHKADSTIDIHMPIEVAGVPDGSEIRADAVTVSFQAPNVQPWRSTSSGVNRRSNGTPAVIFDALIRMDPTAFRAMTYKPVTLRASLYMTLFGNTRSKSFVLQDRPVDVMDGLQCYTGTFGYLFCRSAFRWPARMVYASVSTGTSPLTQVISYSPFPAGIGLNYVEDHWAPGTSSSTRKVTIIAKEPVAHFHRDLDVRDLLLAEFVAGRE
jgi:hypothetical protein